MIKLLVIGNLTKDATTNKVGERTVINFTVAHNEKYKDASGEHKSKVTYVDCAYWSEKTAIVPYLKKGTQVYSEGKPEIKTYSKQDGSTGASFICNVSTVQLLDSKQDAQQPQPQTTAPPTSQQSAANSAKIIEDEPQDLPF
jgi:single-strand DNA-binding protein